MINGFELAWEPTGADPHAAGRRAAARALARFGAALAYDGPRPIARGGVAEQPAIAVSIAHAQDRAVAIAGPAAALGIDLVPDREIDRIARLAPRYLAHELSFATSAQALASCFAAKEAGLKALGLGLLDGGVFDTCAVTVTSLEPPRLAPEDLQLVIERTTQATIAIVYRR